MTRLKIRFKEFMKEQEREQTIQNLTVALEHQTYKQIPGTNNSFREDPPNTNTKTQRHAHVYAKRSGGGKELYSVNLDGSGHDGSSGITIPKSHAEFLRGKGYEIPPTCTLESITLDPSVDHGYELIILEDS